MGSTVELLETLSAINLSILDFKYKKISNKEAKNGYYKSIHIGF